MRGAPQGIAVTGLGLVSCLGHDVPSFAERLFAGECGLAPIRRIDASGLRNTLGGEVSPLPPALAWGPEGLRESAGARFLARAVEEALGDHRVAARPERVGLVVSTNFANAAALEFSSLPGAAVDATVLRYDAVARGLAQHYRLGGPVALLSISCASGTSALGMAADWIRAGRADAVVAAGFDELSLYSLAGLSILRTVSTDTCRPFDRERSGTVFSEGAAALVLEAPEVAEAGGARIRARLLGHADTNNAYHLTAPDKGGEGIRLAIARALEDAEVRPGQVDYVNAHGTATLYHDATEVRALIEVLGPRAREIPVSSIKGASGHLMGAAGAIEAIASILALERQEAPPTVGLREADPDCCLNHVPTVAQPWPMRTVLSNSAGIGGSNASVVLALPA